MAYRFSLLAFLSLIAALAAGVWLTSQGLPPVVATHFGWSGAANGQMHTSTYVFTMVVLVVAVPFVTAVVPSFAISSGKDAINIPNRELWLSGENREATLAFLRAHMRVMGAVMALFLFYVHTLVLRANRLDPPALPAGAMLGGLVVLAVVMLAWFVVLYRRFGARA